MKRINSLAFALCAFAAGSAIAGNFSNAAVPTGIDIVQVGTPGFMLYGDFGNAAGCTIPDAIFVRASHPQYNKFYSTALAAFLSGKKIVVYAHVCDKADWYSVPATTYNTVTDAGSLYIRN